MNEVDEVDENIFEVVETYSSTEPNRQTSRLNDCLLIKSLTYLLSNFKQVVSLARWLSEELGYVRYDSSKVDKCILDADYQVFEAIIHFNKDKTVLNDIMKHCKFDDTIMFIIEALIESKVNLEGYDGTLLNFVCERKLIKEATALLNQGIDVHFDNDKALRNACIYGYTDVVKLLIKYGADIHVFNSICLKTACKHRYIKIVELLLNAGADVYADNDHVLVHACVYNHEDMITLLSTARDKRRK